MPTVWYVIAEDLSRSGNSPGVTVTNGSYTIFRVEVQPIDIITLVVFTYQHKIYVTTLTI